VAAWWRAGREKPQRAAGERVLSVSNKPAVEVKLIIIYQYSILIIQRKEGTSALQVSDMRERDLKDPRGHPGGGFRPRRAGEQGRSLPPPAPPASLSLFRLQDRLCGLDSAACEALPGRSTAAASHENSKFDNPYR
jgi:hypothetical protein